MTIVEQLKHLILQGETNAVQCKVRTDNAYKMGVEKDNKGIIWVKNGFDKRRGLLLPNCVR